MVAERGIDRTTWRRAIVGLVVALLPLSAAAHDRRIVEGAGGEAYLVESWFRDEPLELGQDNAFVLAVTRTGPGEAGTAAGLEATLRAELRGGGERRPLPLAPRADPSGGPSEATTRLYEAPFLLTTPGNYRVRLVGEIDGIPVDVAVFSHEVAPSWLDPLVVPRETERNGAPERQRGAQEPNAAAVPAAGARGMERIGIAAGILGLLVGLLLLWRARIFPPRGAPGARSSSRSEPPKDAGRVI